MHCSLFGEELISLRKFGVFIVKYKQNDSDTQNYLIKIIVYPLSSQEVRKISMWGWWTVLALPYPVRKRLLQNKLEQLAR